MAPSRPAWKRFVPTQRGAVQVLSLIALNASWSPAAQLKWLCPPVMNCHSCPLAVFACPIGVLVHYSGWRLFPLFAAGLLVLFGGLLGRLLCGWVCPFGFVQELLHRIRSPKFSLPRWMTAMKYVVLVLTVFLFPFLWGEATQASFCRWCPTTALQVTVPSLVSGAVSNFTTPMAIKLALMAAVLVACVFFSRFFCRVLCPVGALMAPFNHIAFWKVGPLRERCTACRRCDDACPTEVRPSERLDRGRPANRALDCVTCHDCTTACPVARRRERAQGGLAPATRSE